MPAPDVPAEPAASFEDRFRAAWPRVGRILAAWCGSLDDAEEYAAEAMTRALDQAVPVDDLAAWCVRVAKRRWIDDHRRREVLARVAPELLARTDSETTMDPEDLADGLGDGLDDRLALLFVACDDALPAGAQMVLALRVVCGLTIEEVAGHLGIRATAAAARLTRAKRSLAQARGEFAVPDADERRARLPVVLDCVAGMFTVAHRSGLEPPDPLADVGSQALSIADALVAAYAQDAEVRGLRAVVRLGLARRRGRVDAEGVALTLDEVDRRRWDRRLLTAGLEDAAHAARGSGRFALEAAIAGLHSVAPSVEATDWSRIVLLYVALQRVWPSPAVRVAGLVARSYADPASVEGVAAELHALVAHGPSYAARDATFALADLHWRTGGHDEAAALYRELATVSAHGAVRRFCERRAALGRP